LAARGFLLALDQGIKAILEAPERWPKHRYGCRRYVFPNQYPYTLIYRLTPGVEIVAVAHQKRRPGYWRHR
jgi:plasmid stabilization system protein ParE